MALCGFIEEEFFRWARNGDYGWSPDTRPNALDLILPAEPRTVWLRDFGGDYCPEASKYRVGLRDGPYTDYRITLVDGQPPRIEEVA